MPIINLTDDDLKMANWTINPQKYLYHPQSKHVDNYHVYISSCGVPKSFQKIIPRNFHIKIAHVRETERENGPSVSNSINSLEGGTNLSQQLLHAHAERTVWRAAIPIHFNYSTNSNKFPNFKSKNIFIMWRKSERRKTWKRQQDWMKRSPWPSGEQSHLFLLLLFLSFDWFLLIFWC